MKFISSVGVISIIAAVNAACLSSDYLPASGLDVPCIEVPVCGKGQVEVVINKLATTAAPSKASSVADICYDPKAESITFAITAKNDQKIINSFTGCNSGVFNQDVLEVFIAPVIAGEVGPHCYIESDSSPFNEVFESGIINPNMNTTGMSSSELDCGKSGITHLAHTYPLQQEWTLDMTLPFSVIDCPPGCPTSYGYCKTKPAAYRFNIYRINDDSNVSSCSSSTCEYMAFSPTLTASPSFHQPKHFAVMVLV